MGAPQKIHLEHCNIAVEEFLEMLRFDQSDKLKELPSGTIASVFGMISLYTQTPFSTFNYSRHQ